MNDEQIAHTLGIMRNGRMAHLALWTDPLSCSTFATHPGADVRTVHSALSAVRARFGLPLPALLTSYA